MRSVFEMAIQKIFKYPKLARMFNLYYNVLLVEIVVTLYKLFLFTPKY